MRNWGPTFPLAGIAISVIAAWLVLAGCGASAFPPSPLTPAAATPADRSPAAPPAEPSTTPQPAAAPTSAPRPTSTRAPEMLVPTPLASRSAATRTPATPSKPRPSPTGQGTGTARPPATPGPDRRRVCAGVPIGQITDYDWGDALPGWYMNWSVSPDAPEPGGTRFAQTVRIRQDGFSPPLQVITATAKIRPGALWLLGNEPDVASQDNATPEQYARQYGVIYRAIKETDPTAQVAIAGVSQPTPLRMAYLDRVLDAYRRAYGAEMPVDVWNVHAYVLREERDSWGVGIPPGMEVDRGRLYEIGDHGDLRIFRQQIADFRRWMAARGQRDKPLIVSEYGILMPEDYGFPPDAVAQYLVETFDYFLTARDPQTGYAADDNRLVQAFCWFSAAMDTYPTANLFDPGSRAVTPVGEAFRAYVAALR